MAVLEDYGLLSLFQDGKIPLTADGALSTMFKHDPVINQVVSRCAEHSLSRCSTSYHDVDLKTLADNLPTRKSFSEEYKNFKKFVSSANTAEKRKDPDCLPHFNDFIRSNKQPDKNDKNQVGKLMFQNWIEQSEPELIEKSIIFEQKMLFFYES